jgi:3-phosphoshikimate 1-carboxyvinyltransferase
MDTYHCEPAEQPLDATVVVPGSKSITNRALICAALAEGTSLLSGALLAEDTRCMLDCLGRLGIACTVDEQEHRIEVTGAAGSIPATDARLHCGNSGTTIRFCTALVATGEGRYELDGIERMRERPIGDLAEALQHQGTGVEYLGDEGYPPLVVHARGLRGGTYEFVAPTSSQFVSALMLAAPYGQRDLMLAVTRQVTSAPYLRITAAVMDAFGVSTVEQYGPQEARLIIAAPQRYQACPYSIEPDASNASYFLAAPAIAGGRVSVLGLGTGSCQGDARFVDLLEEMGCTIKRSPHELRVEGPPEGSRLRGIDVDLNALPDMAQTLAVVALFAEGPTKIRNVANLRVKETDRLAALASELRKFGARVEEQPDALVIEPPDRLQPAEVETYNDHRMAMSFALVGLRIPGTVIRDPQCCRKTFPDFFERFERMAQSAG